MGLFRSEGLVDGPLGTGTVSRLGLPARASPELLPTTKRVVSVISQNRYQIGRVAGLNR